MKKKNGFTIYEALVTVTTLSIIFLFLFNIVIDVSNIQSGELKDFKIQNSISIFETVLKDDMLNNTLLSIDECGENCLAFSFQGLGERKLIVNTDEHYLSYNNIGVAIDELADLGDLFYNISTFALTNPYNVDSMLEIHIPITPLYENGFEKDFSINLLQLFNGSDISMNLSTISINEGGELHIPLNGTYTEYGATGHNLNSLVTNGAEVIDTNIAGTYVKTYTASNNHNRTITVSRTIVVGP